MTTQTPTKAQAVARKAELDAALIGRTLRANNGDLFTVERVYRRPNTPSDGPIRPWVAEGELRALVFDFYETPDPANSEGTQEVSGKKKFVRQSVNDQTPPPAPKATATRTKSKKCEECGIRPIDWSTQGRDSTMCTGDYEYAGWENTHNDNGHDIITEPTSEFQRELDDCPVCHPELKAGLYEQAQPAPKPRASKTPKPCKCSEGCTATTNRSFAQGHDARMVSLLTKDVIESNWTLPQAIAKMQQAGGTESLVTKLELAVKNAQAKRSPKPAAEA